MQPKGVRRKYRRITVHFTSPLQYANRATGFYSSGVYNFQIRSQATERTLHYLINYKDLLSHGRCTMSLFLYTMTQSVFLMVLNIRPEDCV